MGVELRRLLQKTTEVHTSSMFLLEILRRTCLHVSLWWLSIVVNLRKGSFCAADWLAGAATAASILGCRHIGTSITTCCEAG